MSAAKSHRVAFGLQAATCALKAKSGGLTDRDRVALLSAALETQHGNEAARHAVLDFITAEREYPVAAGVALRRFLECEMPEIDVHRVENVLASIRAERGAGFDWKDAAEVPHG